MSTSTSTALPNNPSLYTHVSYELLEGNWPVLGLAEQPTAEIIEDIKKAAYGYSITEHIGFLSLGYFLISTELLEMHPTQRPTNQAHIQRLRKDFLNRGILRIANPGVVIGLGDGWYNMKKDTQKHMMIDPQSPHLTHLSNTPNGPIGQIIRGGHRTRAVESLAKHTEGFEDHDYWYYNVLIPGMFSVILYLIQLVTLKIFFLATNDLPRELLHDYSCNDNEALALLEDTYHRLTLNSSLLASYAYSQNPNPADQDFKISRALKEIYKGSYLQFRNFLRFDDATLPLSRLLQTGGFWVMDLERMYQTLAKSKCHQVYY
jgi:hypothetical protein